MVWLNAASRLMYHDPVPFLKRLREFEPKVADSNLPDEVKNLRTNSLKEWGEARQAALFCVGIGDRMQQKVYLAKTEASDYDFIASWIGDDDTRHFAPVQLKEVVPSDINARASVQSTIDALVDKYVDSRDLIVAIYLNQQTHFNPSELRIPRMQIAALWMFGGLAPDGTQWGIWGDFLETPSGTAFSYPA